MVSYESGIMLFNDTGTMIRTEAGSLVGRDGGRQMVSNESGTMLFNDTGTMIRTEAGSLVGQDGGRQMVSNESGTMLFNDTGTMIRSAPVSKAKAESQGLVSEVGSRISREGESTFSMSPQRLPTEPDPSGHPPSSTTTPPLTHNTNVEEVSSSYSTPIRSRAGGSVGQESPSTGSVEERREGDGEVDTTRWKSRLQRMILTQTSSGHVTPNPGSEVGEGESRGSVGEDSQQSPRSRGPYGSSGSDMEDAGSLSLREAGGPKQAESLDTALRGKAPQEVNAYTERTDNSSPPSWKKRLNKVLHN